MFWSLLLFAASPDSSLSAAQSPFTGVWLMDMASIDRKKPIESYRVENDIFFSDGDKIGVNVDGKFHEAGDGDYIDEVSITRRGSNAFYEVYRLKGRKIYTVEYVISENISTMTKHVTDHGKPDHLPMTSTFTYVREGNAFSKIEPITGRWRQVKSILPKGILTETLTHIENKFIMSGPGTYGYEAIIDGPVVSFRGEAENTTISVTMEQGSELVEHWFLKGVATVQRHLIMLPNKDRIKVVSYLLSDGSKASWEMIRQ